ncbi:MAG: hypothetical protein WBC91_26175 [Phototrophicaceae bacterium]
MKPIAWRHMAFWGALSGFVAGGAFMLILLLANLLPEQFFSFSFPTVLVTSHIGAVLGIVLGIVAGFLLDFSLPIETSKFDEEQYQRQRWITLPLIIIVVAVISKPLMDWVITMLWDIMYPELQMLFAGSAWLTAIPAAIAALVAGYAANHYLLRLKKYSEPPRKSHDIARKIKREERLERVTLDDYQVTEARQQRSKQRE